MEGFAGANDRRLRTFVRKLDPALIIGRNDAAPTLLKRLTPEMETWLLTSSSKPMKSACNNGQVASLEEGLSQLEKSEPASLTPARTDFRPQGADWEVEMERWPSMSATESSATAVRSGAVLRGFFNRRHWSALRTRFKRSSEEQDDQSSSKYPKARSRSRTAGS